MKVFEGWYRESSTKGRWHRVKHVDSILNNRQMAVTACGRRISATQCDYDIKPDNMCATCESQEIRGITDKVFAPIGTTSIPTRASAIAELKRLLKPRTYYLRILGNEGAHITAKWEPLVRPIDVSISIYIEYYEIIIKRRTKNVLTLEQIQADLGRFKSAADCLYDASDALALAAKKKKKLKGSLTEEESMAYFEKLLYEAEK